jgi:hypothetical protein
MENVGCMLECCDPTLNGVQFAPISPLNYSS